jgi:hypothetical protein
MAEAAEERSPEDWVDDVKIIDEDYALVAVITDDGRRIIYRVPRRPLVKLPREDDDEDE